MKKYIDIKILKARNLEDAINKINKNEFFEYGNDVHQLDEFLFSKKNINKILKAQGKFYKEAREGQLDADDFTEKEIVDAIYDILLKKG